MCHFVLIDLSLRLKEFSFMVYRIPGLLLGKLEFVGDGLELSLRHALLQLSDAVIREEGVRLHLVFGSQLVQGQAISRNRRIHH